MIQHLEKKVRFLYESTTAVYIKLHVYKRHDYPMKKWRYKDYSGVNNASFNNQYKANDRHCSYSDRQDNDYTKGKWNKNQREQPYNPL
jgi:hypothetical protein